MRERRSGAMTRREALKLGGGALGMFVVGAGGLAIPRGVAQGGDTPNGQLPDISAPNGWLREPQRFPVRVEIDPVDKADVQPPNRSGAQANVVVLTGNAWLFNPLAQLWIRAVAWLSYLR